METFIIILLIIIAVEVTYLTITNFKMFGRTSQSPIFVDTSVLIDGRIVSIAQSGFMSRTLYIPRSVVGELQFLADNADSEKRTRARHGLDVINELQALTTVKTKIFQDGTRAKDGVDNRLLELAKKHNGSICTIDYNLNKVAVVEGIAVLNVNDLAKTLRMAYLPGERTLIEITQKGNDSHQGVGHLSDGTMVVVEQGGQLVGKSVEIEFIRSLQTAAGKMMFAKLVNAPEKKTGRNAAQPKPAGLKPIDKAIRQPRQPRESRESAQQPVQASQATSVDQNPTQQAKAPRAPQQRQSSSRQNNQQPRKQYNRRQSPEDSLIELLNSDNNN
ncbi:MAG: putative PilT domain containing protein [Candidatus Saccharibacteria bacterium]|nr:putative PilT domain containing protein [Candidatus Saccharibacteria bacterium]